MPWPNVTDRDVISVRSAKNRLDPFQPYAFLREQEPAMDGGISDFTTIFLTNRECPFRCTMCDLWKNTLDERVPEGAISAQIRFARARLPPARHLKLYNAGNFFDHQAIPTDQHEQIAVEIRDQETVVVENHPRLTDDRCLRFRDRLAGQLEIALGLESVHPDILASLNKQMTVADFDRATRFLTEHAIRVRTFLLLNPPGLDADAGVDWAQRSLVHALNAGATCVSLIPTRAGNGFMDQLQRSGVFQPPNLRTMETAFERGLSYLQQSQRKARILIDLWDVDRFVDCGICGPQRTERLRKMNLAQELLPPVNCDHCQDHRGEIS